MLGGQLLGDLTANGTYFLLTDALGSVLSEISWAAGGASVQANQLFGPYGNVRYNPGTFNTAKGFTGQYNDQLTGLDYFHARYYDPVVGVFLSADSVQGNLAGLNPYGYVGGNPETYADPSGQMYVPDPGGQDWSHQEQSAPHGNPFSRIQSYGGNGSQNNGGNSCDAVPCRYGAYLQGTTISIVWHSLYADGLGNICSLVCIMVNVPSVAWTYSLLRSDVAIPTQLCTVTVTCTGDEEGNPNGDDWEASEADSSSVDMASDERARPAGTPASDEGLAAGEGPCSFTASTPVATAQGEQAIGTIRPGEEVEAYNPQTHQMELKPVLHVWINHDHDLVDLTLTTSVPARHGKPATKTSEVIHTNQKHPFLTREKGFLPVGQIKLGMHILRADGTDGVVTGWRSVPGTQVMYNLEVAQDHTFTVGAGQWVVHNCAKPTPTHLDIVPYKTDVSSIYEKHHGVLDVWAKNNIPGYNRMEAPTIVLTVDEHMATRSYFAQWRVARTGSLTGFIDWKSMSAPEIQALVQVQETFCARWSATGQPK